MSSSKIKKIISKKSVSAPVLEADTKLSTLALKYLEDRSSEDELVELFEETEAILKKGKQWLLDSITAQISEKNRDFLEDWKLFLSSLCTSCDNLQNLQGDAIRAKLFLIPVIFSLHSQVGAEVSAFEIVQLGKIRNLMVKCGLISGSDENMSMLTRFFTYDELGDLSECDKYQILEKLIFQKKYNFKISSSEKLLPGVLDVKYRFLIACAHLRDEEPISPFSRFIDSVEDKKLENSDCDKIVLFTNELSLLLPEWIGEKEGVQVSTFVAAPVEFNNIGIELALEEYDRFKRGLFLGRAENSTSSWVKISQSEENVLDLSLFQSDKQIDFMQLNLFRKSEEERNEFINELIQDFLKCGYSIDPESKQDEIVFLKGKKVSNLRQLRSRTIYH